MPFFVRISELEMRNTICPEMLVAVQICQAPGVAAAHPPMYSFRATVLTVMLLPELVVLLIPFVGSNWQMVVSIWCTPKAVELLTVLPLLWRMGCCERAMYSKRCCSLDSVAPC